MIKKPNQKKTKSKKNKIKIKIITFYLGKIKSNTYL